MGRSIEPCTSREAASALDKVVEGVQQAMPAFAVHRYSATEPQTIAMELGQTPQRAGDERANACHVNLKRFVLQRHAVPPLRA